MPFKVKDLMIDVTSAIAPQKCFNFTHVTICQFYCSHQVTIQPCHFACSFVQSYCQYGSVTHTITVTCGGSIPDTTPIIQTINQVSGPALANLKDQLKQALDLAERQTTAEGESMQVQSVADAEMLEKKLTEAIDEVRTRKAELQKKK